MYESLNEVEVADTLTNACSELSLLQANVIEKSEYPRVRYSVISMQFSA